jgi:hypothetical protein
MFITLRRRLTHPALALLAACAAGMLEWAALARARWLLRR